MEYFMRCPERDLDPPDVETPERRRCREIMEKIETIDEKIDQLRDEKESLEWLLEEMGFVC